MRLVLNAITWRLYLQQGETIRILQGSGCVPKPFCTVADYLARMHTRISKSYMHSAMGGGAMFGTNREAYSKKRHKHYADMM